MVLTDALLMYDVTIAVTRDTTLGTTQSLIDEMVQFSVKGGKHGTPSSQYDTGR